jgi:plastocyanin
VSERSTGSHPGWLLLVFVLVLAFVFLAAFGGYGAVKQVAAAFPPTGPDKVNIQYLEYRPVSLEVPVGTTVTWTNNDLTAHTVSEDATAGFVSPVMNPGDTFTHKFDKAGRVTYHDDIQPYITGEVVVK